MTLLFFAACSKEHLQMFQDFHDVLRDEDDFNPKEDPSKDVQETAVEDKKDEVIDLTGQDDSECLLLVSTLSLLLEQYPPLCGYTSDFFLPSSPQTPENKPMCIKREHTPTSSGFTPCRKRLVKAEPGIYHTSTSSFIPAGYMPG